MIVETRDDVELLDGFRWFTLGEVHRLLGMDDLVNMDSRTVLSCLPLAGHGVIARFGADNDDVAGSVVRSYDAAAAARHSTVAVLSAITDARTRIDVSTRSCPLTALPGWHRSNGRLSHVSGAFFDVIQVQVQASGREVSCWSQPMIAVAEIGVVAFLVTRIDGVMHALVHLRVQPGYVDVVEVAPTVQCTPANYDHLPRSARPPYLDHVLEADRRTVHFDTVLSEEGGRFFHTRNRYLIMEADSVEIRPDYLWLTVEQLAGLLQHSHYVNVEARSLVVCLHSLSAPHRGQARTHLKAR